MPRGLSPAQNTALSARVKRPIYFVELDLATAGPIRVWNGVGDVSALTFTWKGLGEFGIIDGIETDRGLKAQSITLALAGLPGSLITPGVIAATRSERYQGRPLTVYFALADPGTGAPLHDPVIIWSGVADVLTFQLGTSATVELTGEHFSSHMRRANGLRMSTENHNQRLGNPSPRDLFFEPQDRLMGRPKPLIG